MAKAFVAKKLVRSFAYAAVSFFVPVLILGGPGYAVGIVAAVLLVAWRHDNNAGVFFPLAILVLITLAVLLLIFYLLVRLHR